MRHQRPSSRRSTVRRATIPRQKHCTCRTAARRVTALIRICALRYIYSVSVRNEFHCWTTWYVLNQRYITVAYPSRNDCSYLCCFSSSRSFASYRAFRPSQFSNAIRSASFRLMRVIPTLF